jgi:hypothetical protein
MRKAAPFFALSITLGAFVGAMRLWWVSAPVNETRYMWDYCRFTLGIPSNKLWPYRIEAVQHLPITALSDAVYGGRPLYQVLIWPLVATMIAGVIGLFLASLLSGGPNSSQDRVIRGPKLVTSRQFNLRTIFQRKGAFYIETK